MKVSACLIVKNEEKVIEQCLSSLYSLADEIVVIDTGSTDKTVEICRRYTNNIYSYTWNYNFADARNYAIEKANGDWIIFLDADEYLEDGTRRKLLPLLHENLNKKDIDVFYCKFINLNGNQIKSIHRHVRIFRNVVQLRYEGEIHEQLKRQGKLPRAIDAYDLITIYHTGYNSDILISKAERNLAMLLKRLENNKEDYLTYFYLGDAYMVLGDYEKVIAYEQVFIDSKMDVPYFGIQSYLNLLNSSINLKRPFDELITIIQKAKRRYPGSIDILEIEANVFYKFSYFEESLKSYKEAVKLSAKDDGKYVTFTKMDNLYSGIGNIYRWQNKDTEAFDYYLKALTINRHNKSAFVGFIKVIQQEEITLQIEFINSIYDVANCDDISFLNDTLVSLRNDKLLLYYNGILRKTFNQIDERFTACLLSNGFYDQAITSFHQRYLIYQDAISETFIITALMLCSDRDKYMDLVKPFIEYYGRFIKSFSTSQEYGFEPSKFDKIKLVIQELIKLKQYSIIETLIINNCFTRAQMDIIISIMLEEENFDWIIYLHEKIEGFGARPHTLGIANYRLHRYEEAELYLKIAIEEALDIVMCNQLLTFMK